MKIPMSIAFRADASLEIGTGHVMRCLTLADALRDRGARCRFVSRRHPGNLLEIISRRGYPVDALPIGEHEVDSPLRDVAVAPSHARWLGAGWETDARQTRQALRAGMVDWLIVDHYALDARWERALRPVCRRLMVIDDLADRGHDCDLLLDQNLGRTAADYADLVPPECTLLAGPRYALLRPEFSASRQYSLQRREKSALHHVLITMGGIDTDNATGRVLDALRACVLPANCRITVVLGLHAPWIDEVRVRASTMPQRTELLIDVEQMAQLMADCDLVIGAAGSTSWERCALGIPAYMLVLAQNQRTAADAIVAAGAAELLGDGGALEKVLSEKIRQLGVSLGPLHEMSVRARELCDGTGASVVSTCILTPGDSTGTDCE